MIGRAMFGVVLGVAAIALGDRPAAQSRFRSGVLRVAVNVAVRLNNAPVPGLQAADFELTDNGVRQTIDEVAVETVPIDVTVIVDTSGSIFGAFDRMRRDTQQMARLLRPEDRLRVLTIDTYVHQPLPMQPAGVVPSLRDTPVNGTSAVYDGLAAGLIFPVPLDRRHLVMALTDTLDTISSNDAARIDEIARRSDAVLHVVLVSGESVPSLYRPWIPYRDYQPATLRAAAERTGGMVHDRGSDNPLTAFRRVVEDFRGSYVLRYNLQGVKLAGWHDVAVTVTRPGSYSVRARKGYFGR